MGIGLVGKPAKTRLITGSIHYGQTESVTREAENLWQHNTYGKIRRKRRLVVAGKRSD